MSFRERDISEGGAANREEQDDHGTSMASIIAGHGHGAGNSQGVKGLAPDAKILPVAIPREDDVSAQDQDGLAEALKYAVDNGASVINMSVDLSVLTEKDKEALSYAIKKDVLLAVATGNEGRGHLGELPAYPGVVAVGAVDKAGQVWDESNSGPQTMLAAPGTHIRSAAASKPYRLANGTSDSAAYVSAAAALLRAKFPDLTAGQIANRLVKTAGLPPGQEGMKLPDPHYGYGFIRPLQRADAEHPHWFQERPAEDPEGGAGSRPGGPSLPAPRVRVTIRPARRNERSRHGCHRGHRGWCPRRCRDHRHRRGPAEEERPQRPAPRRPGGFGGPGGLGSRRSSRVPTSSRARISSPGRISSSPALRGRSRPRRPPSPRASDGLLQNIVPQPELST